MQYILATQSEKTGITKDRLYQHVTDGQTVLLHRIWVHPDHRKKGIATKLWEFLLATVNGMIPKPQRISLGSQEHLVDMYRNFGFSLLGPTDVYDDMIGKHVKHYEMEHTLVTK